MQPSPTPPSRVFTTERIQGIVQVGLILYLFLRFARISLRAGFTSDDMLNLYQAWEKPVLRLLGENLLYFSSGYRPLGALFYRLMFAVAGLNPLPFRIVVLGLLLLNLYLLYRVAAAAATREIGILAALLLSFSASFVDVYYNTGTIYDVLCFTFYFSALALYAGVRKQDRWLTPRQLALFLVFYICALNSKEMAVTLPSVLLVYELLFVSPGSAPRAWLRRWTPLASITLLTLPYMAGKLSGSSPLIGNEAYQLHLSQAIYFTTLAHYFSMLAQAPGVLTAGVCITVLLLLAAAAVLARERCLLFALLFTLIAPLPVLFVPVRGTFVMYIPAFGIALYLAATLVFVRDRLAAGFTLRPSVKMALQAVTFLLCMVALIRYHGVHPLSPPPQDAIGPLVATYAELRSHVPVPKRILFLDDPFPADEWTTVFVCRLYFHSLTVVADRIKMLPSKPDQAAMDSYDVIFTYSAGRYTRVKPPG
jgi:hypothetical protein